MGEKNIDILIQNMKPVLNDGDYVFVSVLTTEKIDSNKIISQMKEKEGITLILPKTDAEHYKLPYDYVASWITLNIHSSLEAVGLTAAFSSALAKNNISCNVIAGYYHDHIFVDKRDGSKAMTVLNKLSNGKSI